MKPESDATDYILDKVIEDCRDNLFHTFEHRCVYDIQFKNVTSKKENIITITHRYMHFKSEI